LITSPLSRPSPTAQPKKPAEAMNAAAKPPRAPQNTATSMIEAASRGVSQFGSPSTIPRMLRPITSAAAAIPGAIRRERSASKTIFASSSTRLMLLLLPRAGSNAGVSPDISLSGTDGTTACSAYSGHPRRSHTSCSFA
jgi:hypothetical protein